MSKPATNYGITVHPHYENEDGSPFYRLPLKRICAGYYQTHDGAFEVVRTVYPGGEVVWYAKDEEGADDVFATKTEAVDSLARMILAL